MTISTTGRLRGKRALVTGAGSGIGAACALALAREGAAVAVADIDLASAQRQAALIGAEGGRAIALQVDLGDEAAVAAMVDGAAAQLGGLDILHNNAADTRLSATRDRPVETMET
uniref:SDR family NAD(P)-dependent oxidoreductase n=1 Tax=Ideonella sp. B508-1 TaxID=137716 RepID=UPI0003B5E3C7